MQAVGSAAALEEDGSGGEAGGEGEESGGEGVDFRGKGFADEAGGFDGDGAAAWAGEEAADDVFVERDPDGEEGSAGDGWPEVREEDEAEGGGGGSAEVAGGVEETPVEAVESGGDEEEDVGEGEETVAEDHGGEAWGECEGGEAPEFEGEGDDDVGGDDGEELKEGMLPSFSQCPIENDPEANITYRVYREEIQEQSVNGAFRGDVEDENSRANDVLRICKVTYA
jgi:hypothetical protein